MISLAVPENSGGIVGMSADTDIVLADRLDALLVPDRAINYDNEDNALVTVVFGGEKKEIVKRPVVTGLSDGFRTEIKSGLEEDELVLIETQSRESALERLGFSD